MRTNKPQMWPEKYAHIKAAGKPYRPSNGTEGEIFEAQWCPGCYFNGRCNVLMYAMAFDADDKNYPKELVISADGQPECTKFEERRPPKPRAQHKASKGQGSLF